MEGLIILVLLALAAIPVILPIVSLVMASRTRARLQALEEATARLQDELNSLTTRIRQARTAPVDTPEAAAPETGASRAPAPVPRQAPLPAAPRPPHRCLPHRCPLARCPPPRAASRPQAAGRTPASPRGPTAARRPSFPPGRPLRRPRGRLDRRSRAGSTGRAWWACASSPRWRASRW